MRAADGPTKVGYSHGRRGEGDRELVVARSRGGKEEGVVLWLGELEVVVGIHEERAGERAPFQERIRLAVGAVEPAPVAVAEGRLALVERPLGLRRAAEEDGERQERAGHP